MAPPLWQHTVERTLALTTRRSVNANNWPAPPLTCALIRAARTKLKRAEKHARTMIDEKQNRGDTK